MQDACHMNLLTIESLWLSSRASECGIRRFEVRFLMLTQNFLLWPTLMTRRKTSFLYFFTEPKAYHLFIVLVISYFKSLDKLQQCRPLGLCTLTFALDASKSLVTNALVTWWIRLTASSIRAVMSNGRAGGWSRWTKKYKRTLFWYLWNNFLFFF